MVLQSDSVYKNILDYLSGERSRLHEKNPNSPYSNADRNDKQLNKVAQKQILHTKTKKGETGEILDDKTKEEKKKELSKNEQHVKQGQKSSKTKLPAKNDAKKIQKVLNKNGEDSNSSPTSVTSSATYIEML